MKKRIFHAALYMVGTIILGTVGFIFLEGMTFFQAVYLTIATITTVGYGDAVPHTLTGKILTMVLMVAGVGVALSATVYCTGFSFFIPIFPPPPPEP